MENLQNYTRYTGNENPVDKLVDTANVHETDVLTDAEIVEKEKLENGDLEEIADEVADEVLDVPTEESLKHIKKFGEFNV